MSIAYYHYEHISVQGWEKNDTISFDVPPVVNPGIYNTTIGIRINNAYPLKTLCLIVEQTIYPRRTIVRDTVVCVLTTDKGKILGQGISTFQYEVPTKHKVTLAPKDSIHYSVRHDMQRSILPGISDIGIKLQRQKNSK